MSIPVFDTLAALRAATPNDSNGDTVVEVRGHTNANDGGGGTFYFLKAYTTTPPTGVDDGGWHILTNTKDELWGRVADVNIPQQWGVFPTTTPAAASLQSDQSEKLQKFLDFWSNPADAFPGWAERTSGGAWPTRSVVGAGYYRCDVMLEINFEETTSGSFFNVRMPSDLIFDGYVFTPEERRMPAFRVRGHRTPGKSRVVLRGYKERASNDECKWASYGWPSIAEHKDTYRLWASGLTVYAGERIQHALTDKEVLYLVDSDGDLGTTAPSHDVGAATNGDVSLTALGTLRVKRGTEMLSLDDALGREWDACVWVDDLSDTTSLEVWPNGFAIGVLAKPLDGWAGWVGWNRISVPAVYSCKVGVLFGHTWFGQNSGGSAASNTNWVNCNAVEMGLVARELSDDYVDDEGNYGVYFTNIVEPVSGWTSGGTIHAEEIIYHTISSTRYWYANKTEPPTNGTLGTTAPTKTVAGQTETNGTVTLTCLGPRAVGTLTGMGVGPTHNRVTGLSVERPLTAWQSGDYAADDVVQHDNKVWKANDMITGEQPGVSTKWDQIFPDLIQAMFSSGDENVVECRNDAPASHRAMKCANHSDRLVAPNNNLVHTAREWIGVEDPGLSWNNGRRNVVREMPRDQVPTEYIIHDLRKHIFPSGQDRAYLSGVSAWSGFNSSPHHFLEWDAPSLQIPSMHGDGSFNITTVYPLCVFVEAKANKKQDVVVEIEKFHTDYTAALGRAGITPINSSGALIDVVDWTPKPVYQSDGTPGKHTSTQLAYVVANADRFRSVSFGLASWIRRFAVLLYGDRLAGFAIRVYGGTNARIWSPGDTLTSNTLTPTIDAKPQKGVFEKPSVFQYSTPVGGNTHTRLTAGGSAPYWATGGLTTGGGAVTHKDGRWAHDGSGKVFESRNGSWVEIASGVTAIDTSGWTDF